MAQWQGTEDTLERSDHTRLRIPRCSFDGREIVSIHGGKVRARCWAGVPAARQSVIISANDNVDLSEIALAA